MTEHWLEINSPTDQTTLAIYAAADKHGAGSIHHFSEPWYEDGFVVRVMAAPKLLGLIARAATRAGAEPHDWDATPDERLYGPLWPAVRSFFEAASRLALVRESWAGETSWLDRKVIHCTLNSWGYEVADERFFARAFAKERKRMLKLMRKSARAK